MLFLDKIVILHCICINLFNKTVAIEFEVYRKYKKNA